MLSFELVMKPLLRYTYIFVLFFLTLSQFHIRASIRPNLIDYSKSDGLISNSVFFMLQDSKKHIWFCTANGLSLFDGNRFRNFSREDGIAESAIFYAFEYGDQIWFGGYQGKLFYYDYQTQQMHSPEFSEELSQQMKSGLLRYFVVDQYNIWVQKNSVANHFTLFCCRPV